jgi:hypothetical protein
MGPLVFGRLPFAGVAEGDFHAGPILAACRRGFAAARLHCALPPVAAAGAAKAPRPMAVWGGIAAVARTFRYQATAFPVVAGLTGTPAAAAALIRD